MLNVKETGVKQNLKTVRETLRQMLDGDELSKFRGKILATGAIKVLNERGSIYPLLFSCPSDTSRIPSNRIDTDLQCVVSVNNNVVDISIKEFETGKEVFNHQVSKGVDCDIEPFEFWKIKIKCHKEDQYVLTLPIE